MPQFIKPTAGLVTSFFNPQRKNPVTGVYKPHTGVDFGWYGTDDEVVAAADGRVVVPRVSSVAGNYIWIEHSNGYTSVYSHLKSIKVKTGQRVKQGQVIGIKGTTGNSTGVHLHFEIIKHSTFTNDWSKKCNPLLFIVDPTTKEWQGWLKELGYYKGAIDGIYGDSTIKAVLDYQKANRLGADGVCGRTTYAHIKNAHSKLDKKPVSKAPVDETLYRLFTGTFKSKQAAEKALDAIKQKFGWACYLDKVNGSYRVKTGTFIGKTLADNAATRVKKDGIATIVHVLKA